MRKDLLLLFFITIASIVNAQSVELKDAFAKVSSTLKDYKFESQDVAWQYPVPVGGTKSISIQLKDGNIIFYINDDLRPYSGESLTQFRHGKKSLKVSLSKLAFSGPWGKEMKLYSEEGVELNYNNKKELLESYALCGAEISLKKLHKELTALIAIANNENFNGTLGNAIDEVSTAKASSSIKHNLSKTIRMKKMVGNTYIISCKVNGLPLDFIFDTGASSVTLSRKQAMFMLKNGYLSKSDIIGTNAYQTATGDIAIGAVVKLKKIEINGLVLNNVEASIINSDSAPLLLGQSALSRLGKIQIDYKNSTLTIIR